MLLRKLGLSENFPRSVLHSMKPTLGLGSLALRTIIDILPLKLYFRCKRINDKVAKLMKINKDNPRIQHGCSKGCLEVERDAKPNRIIWSNEVEQKISRRKLVLVNQMEESK